MFLSMDGCDCEDDNKTGAISSLQSQVFPVMAGCVRNLNEIVEKVHQKVVPVKKTVSLTTLPHDGMLPVETPLTPSKKGMSGLTNLQISLIDELMAQPVVKNSDVFKTVFQTGLTLEQVKKLMRNKKRCSSRSSFVDVNKKTEIKFASEFSTHQQRPQKKSVVATFTQLNSSLDTTECSRNEIILNKDHSEASTHQRGPSEAAIHYRDHSQASTHQRGPSEAAIHYRDHPKASIHQRGPSKASIHRNRSNYSKTTIHRNGRDHSKASIHSRDYSEASNRYQAAASASSRKKPEESDSFSLTKISTRSLDDIAKDLERVKVCSIKIFRNVLYSEWEEVATQLLVLATSDILVSNDVVFKAARLLRTTVLPEWTPFSGIQEEIVNEWMEMFLIKLRPTSVREGEQGRAFVETAIMPWAPVFMYGKLVEVDELTLGLSGSVADAFKKSKYQLKGMKDYVSQLLSLIEQ